MDEHEKSDLPPILAGCTGAAAITIGALGETTSSAEELTSTEKAEDTLFNGMPCGRIGGVSISRVLLCGNLLEGIMHSRDLKYVPQLFKAVATDEHLAALLKTAETNGINTVFGRGLRHVQRYNKGGGSMQFIAEIPVDLPLDKVKAAIKKNVDDGAVAHFTNPCATDELVRTGKGDQLTRIVELARKEKIPVGVGAWALPVIAFCEEKKVPCDYYAKTMHDARYPSVQLPDQRKEYIQASKDYFDNMWCTDAAQVAELFSKVTKPWIATKTLAAGAITPRNGMTFAFDNGADFVSVGMLGVHVKPNCDIARRLIDRARRKRERPWMQS